MSTESHTVTRLLAAASEGDDSAIRELFPLVYEEMRVRARRQRGRWHGDYTLNTTALIHEAFLKLVDGSTVEWRSRAHFLSVASKAMRSILIDYARQRLAEKRGGEVEKLSVEELGEKGMIVVSEERAETLVALDEALERLARSHPRQARIVECRFFGGMSIEETAEALDVSPSTVKRGWTMARARLYRALREGG